MVGLLATTVSLLIGVTYGATAGYIGGRTDNVMMRIVDMMYSLPFMFFVILLMVIFGRNIFLIFVALGAVEWLTMARIVRGQTLSVKEKGIYRGGPCGGRPDLEDYSPPYHPQCPRPGDCLYDPYGSPGHINREFSLLSRSWRPGTDDQLGSVDLRRRKTDGIIAMAAHFSSIILSCHPVLFQFYRRWFARCAGPQG